MARPSPTDAVTHRHPPACTVSTSSDIGPRSMSFNSLPWHTPSTCQTTTQAMTSTVPAKRQFKIMRHLRYTCFTVYRRLFSIVFLANVIATVLVFIKYGYRNVPSSIVTTAASGNFFVAVLVRQDFFVNMLYSTSWLVPRTAPLRLRRLVAKVYENGGVHSGAAVAGTMWFIVLNIMITGGLVRGEAFSSTALFCSTWALQVTLLVILFCSHPYIRARTHNTFEYTHRLGGWLAIVLFWVESLMIIATKCKALGVTIASVLVQHPAFWLLTATTVLLILPWLRLRHWEFTPEKLSSHAMRLHYTQNLKRFSCLFISDSPLLQWHPFATFPARDREPGGSMVISDAGDWTHNLILNPAKKYWVKGLPTYGTLSMACIFQRVILVTTGSGIGPSLGYLLDRPEGQFCRLIWSTRTPVHTYGAALNDWIHEIEPNALVLDTNKTGRPDLVQLAYQMYMLYKAEAVFVLSNETVTRKVVYGMESRGIPAYGPIWDS
ncbi:uncharacterized protein BDZ99DRAFT_490758 [Mytilinidion resinicola]|uniref:Integral membrane protein TmpA n=1 Tax=Mytilinidion resinicola TaxID=574789 RepID=A0A6A6YBD9_9PEZI|nr:uncharacterized protein BDZ99DRAFT_490758 [Mytilinidion resinicola]KAF2805147.1 hypothetical protein BDZ99DRAFT_490758 [Mytilinidion resinicola]